MLRGTATPAQSEPMNNGKKKNDSTHLRAPELEPHCWMQFCVQRIQISEMNIVSVSHLI